MYESQVSFTLDTVCPWLDQALSQVRASSSDSSSPSAVNFTLHFEPFQLYPDFPASVDKSAWYLAEKHNNNEAAQAAFQEHMKALASPLGAELRFDGPMGNTFASHRVIQLVQERHSGERASEGTKTSKLVDALYRMYFTEARHPAAEDTLLEACVAAGLGEEEARALVMGDEGERDVRQRLREVAMDVDAVPVVMIEGKKRDITLTGAKEVKDYVKALEQIIKESS